ncbi:MAG: type 4a pilus biogenesis protein PilO [Planctomycetes bacterium]|nr:type 4a pilus biogenesis protein PilO [Planctomycetota bacterium]
MTENGRKLAWIAGGAVGVYFGYTAIEAVYIDPRAALIAGIEKQEERQSKLLDEIDQTRKTALNWTTQTGRTLSAKRDEAHFKFRDQIVKLLKEHHLAAGHTLNQNQPTEIKKDSRKGMVELPINVTTDGTLENLSAFLEAVQALPYYVSVDSLVLNPQDQGGKDKRATASKDGPTLRIQMTLSTVVLPKKESAPHKVCDLAAERLEPALKPHAPDRGGYAVVSTMNLFRPYSPPEPPPREKDPAVVKGPEKPPTPTPPAAKPDNRVLIGTPSLNGVPIAFVQDPAKKSEPPEELHLNTAISDEGNGKLVLVHPKGIVVRVFPNTGTTTKTYFVALGQKMSEREELTAQNYPDVHSMLLRAMPQQ